MTPVDPSSFPRRLPVGKYGHALRRACVVALLLLVILSTVRPGPTPSAAQPAGFTFALAVDQRNYAGIGYDSVRFFRGAVEAMRAHGPISFLVSPGDIDPPGGIRWTLDQVMGTNFLWYPGVGNHELEAAANMVYLRGYNYDQNGAGVPPDIVRQGPPKCPTTTYSFDYQNAHFAMLNEYCDSTGDSVAGGDVSDYLYHWLVEDLNATTKPFIFVLGHEPAYPQADQDTKDMRHPGNSLDANPAHRDRFWNLLRSKGVLAYITGHTHRYSIARVNGVWQIDGGHARGDGDPTAPSTFVLIHVNPDSVTFDTYRETFDGLYDYTDRHYRGTLATAVPPAPARVPTSTPVPTATPVPVPIHVGDSADSWVFVSRYKTGWQAT